MMNTSTPSPTIERLVFPIVAFVVSALFVAMPGLVLPSMQILGLAVMVILLGLPHGALDPWVAELIGLSETPKQAIIFNVAYLLIAGLVVVTWLLFPVTSLMIFLAISAWHFSGDWKHDHSMLLRICAGVLLIAMPIAFHTENVALIFTQLSGADGGSLAHSLAVPKGAIISSMVALIAVASYQHKWLSALEYVGLLTLAYAATPLVYFTLYFCLLHSPRHLSGLLRYATPKERPRLFRMALTYTVLTLILIVILYFFWSALPIDSLILKLVFIGLAAVTVPHMILIAMAHVRLKQ